MKLSPFQWAIVASAAAVVAGGGLALWIWRPEDDVGSEDETPVGGSPPALAAAAGVDIQTYCLARATASEAGGLSRTAQQAVACAIVNFAQSEGLSVADLVLGTARAFGRQGSGGRRVASTRAPAALQLEIAAAVMAGEVGDPTGGATQFDSPSGQRRLIAQGDPLSRKTPDEIAALRAAAGYELVTVPGVDPDTLRFWRRA